MLNIMGTHMALHSDPPQILTERSERKATEF